MRLPSASAGAHEGVCACVWSLSPSGDATQPSLGEWPMNEQPEQMLPRAAPERQPSPTALPRSLRDPVC